MLESRTEDLTSFVERMGGDKALRIEENLGQGFVRLRVAEAERRQAAHDIRCSEDIVIEMLRNARDAHASNIFVATSRVGTERIVTVLDDGDGMPREMRGRVFDARVTSKLDSVRMDRWGVHGRGMALYSIRENALSAEVVDSVIDGGSALRVVTDTDALPERADQSSWPVMGTDEQGQPCVERGPHNIVRTCCEFALEERGGCEVYVGSPAEVASTARARIRPALPAADLMLVDDLSALPVLDRFHLASDARELVQVAVGCGLELSERTAHRILSGAIKPLTSIAGRLTRARREGTGQPARVTDLSRDRRGLRLADEDAREFQRMLERDFEFIARRYYLTLAAEPRLRVSGNRLSVTFEYEGED
ncbi:MAG: ATP-binding protein [Acidobacteriota bacterium]|nr:ATP-binding protein [Acidobacteriota bacterium]